MYVCAICNREVRDVGAFLPGENSDFVCLPCFAARHGHQPLPEDTENKATINRFGIRHRPGKPSPKARIRYVVTVKPHATSQVRKKLAKRNILASINLPPGSYHF